MSDYKPITGELRERIGQSEHIVPLNGEMQYTQVRINLAWLKEKLDAIDAIHAGLEREYAATLAEREGDWIKLPVDADGLPIHVGDMLAGEKAGGFGLCEPFEVGCILFGRDIVQVNDVHGLTRCVEFAHHYVPDTWERIIYDAVAAGRTDEAVDLSPIIRRCKALAGEIE